MAGRRVAAYRNLHLPCRAYSLRDVSTGRVCARVADVLLVRAQLRVQQAGQARARTDGVRNVHAFVYGVIPCEHVAARGGLQSP
jgi:hypothetical protein